MALVLPSASSFGFRHSSFFRHSCFVIRHCSASADRKSTRLNSSHGYISYAVFCLKKNIISTLATVSSPVPVISIPLPHTYDDPSHQKDDRSFIPVLFASPPYSD